MTNEDLLQEHKKRMAKIKRQNTEAKYRAEEETEKKKYKPTKKKIATSKIVLAVMFAVCIEIIIYSQWAMYRLGDLTALITLLGIPACMTTALVSYYHKSGKENTSGGIVYETAMREFESNDEEVVG